MPAREHGWCGRDGIVQLLAVVLCVVATFASSCHKRVERSKKRVALQQTKSVRAQNPDKPSAIETPIGVIFEIRPGPSKGWHYPYYLFVPKDAREKKDRRLLVDCDNTPPQSSQQYFDEQAKNEARGGWAEFFARQLQVPSLVPAFPRERFSGHENYIYAQFLNRAAVQRNSNAPGGPIDLQLVAMIEDAEARLREKGMDVADKVFLNGYSASAKFAQRFTILHPDRVMATVAGGVAGTTVYPMAKYHGETLRYPIGVADLKKLTGRTFDATEFAEVPEFFYMGEKDDNDATEWRDCYTKQDAEQIWRLFGRRQTPDRWASTQKILASAAPQITCKTYPTIGHAITQDVEKDVIAFLKAHWTC